MALFRKHIYSCHIKVTRSIILSTCIQFRESAHFRICPTLDKKKYFTVLKYGHYDSSLGEPNNIFSLTLQYATTQI